MGTFSVIQWLDRDLHIYQITVPESLDTVEQRAAFLDELYEFIMPGPDGQYALVDMTRFKGRLVGLTDPKLSRQRNTEIKTRAVAVLTSSTSAQIIVNTIRALFFNKLPWRFFRDRAEAEAFLREYAQRDLGLS